MVNTSSGEPLSVGGYFNSIFNLSFVYVFQVAVAVSVSSLVWSGGWRFCFSSSVKGWIKR